MAQPKLASLPPGFVSIQCVMEGKLSIGSRVNLAGVVTDLRAPVPTRGQDWKCQMQIYDQSVENDFDRSLTLNVFRPEKEMPDVQCGDVIVVFAAKIQRYLTESISIWTNWGTDIYIYLAGKIPMPPQEASVALRPSTRRTTRRPSQAENKFVSILYNSIDKSRIPDEASFEVMKAMSTNVKNKFCELKDVRDGGFADMVVEVVNEPYDLGDRYTLWVSDYSENPSFYHFSFEGFNQTRPAQNADPNGDPNGYLVNYPLRKKQHAEWAGPFGKRSMQVTCYEPHASAIRELELSRGAWVTLKNVQVKFGHNGANLEGFLREDRNTKGVRINIVPMDISGDPETVRPELKNALRRRRDYEKKKRKQVKHLVNAATNKGKRKAEQALPPGPSAPNRRMRRDALQSKANRARKEEGGEEGIEAEKEEAEAVFAADLNVQVKCENERRKMSLVADMREPTLHKTTIDGEAVELALPFINANFRLCVRVVGFYPLHLEEFARPKKKTEYDVLSDNDDSSSGVDSGNDTETTSDLQRSWEWYFHLLLEDAAVNSGRPKQRVWVVVDNQAAQCLTGLDASDLRSDAGKLETLRQRLFLLWGNLEESVGSAYKKSGGSSAGALEQPPHSSDEEMDGQGVQVQVTNRPFLCCIRQYGVKVSEKTRAKANAGPGRRWQQMFGLFGTKILPH